MNKMLSAGDTSTPENTRRLVNLRYLVVAGQAAALLAAHALFGWTFPIVPVSLILCSMAAINLITQLRLRAGQRPTERVVLGQLFADIAGLTLLLYFTGGAGNPMVSLYLLPVVIAATVLATPLVWLVAGVAIACYTAVFFQVPVPADHSGHEGGGFSVHLLGMWFAFLLSAGLIAHFTGRMARSVRKRDALLAAAREEALRSERIVALGTMAAGAAHELGTPLNTLLLLVDEIAQTSGDSPLARERVTELKEQIANCKQVVSGLLAAAQHGRSESARPCAADEFLDEVAAKWQLIRPLPGFECRWKGPRPGPQVFADQTIQQALVNLLNNAADASPREVLLEAQPAGDRVLVRILDRGPGFTPEAARRAGEPFFSTKPPGQGHGIGLFLANATIERFGGSVRQFHREGGGTCTEIALPTLTPEQP